MNTEVDSISSDLFQRSLVVSEADVIQTFCRYFFEDMMGSEKYIFSKFSGNLRIRGLEKQIYFRGVSKNPERSGVFHPNEKLPEPPQAYVSKSTFFASNLTIFSKNTGF